MSRTLGHSLIILAALTASSGAHERAHHDNPPIQPGARASVAATSQTDIFRRCEEQARLRWGTNTQDMQTPRDFAYRACVFDHDMRNP